MDLEEFCAASESVEKWPALAQTVYGSAEYVVRGSYKDVAAEDLCIGVTELAKTYPRLVPIIRAYQEDMACVTLRPIAVSDQEFAITHHDVAIRLVERLVSAFNYNGSRECFDLSDSQIDWQARAHHIYRSPESNRGVFSPQLSAEIRIERIRTLKRLQLAEHPKGKPVAADESLYVRTIRGDLVKLLRVSLGSISDWITRGMIPVYPEDRNRKYVRLPRVEKNWLEWVQGLPVLQRADSVRMDEYRKSQMR